MVEIIADSTVPATGGSSSGGSSGGPDCSGYTGDQKELCESLKALPNTQANDAYAQNIFNAAYGVAGLIAVIIIVVGAIQYITSGGNPAQATKAKNTITYAIIGLVIIILATLITNFVIGIISGAK